MKALESPHASVFQRIGWAERPARVEDDKNACLSESKWSEGDKRNSAQVLRKLHARLRQSGRFTRERDVKPRQEDVPCDGMISASDS